MFSTRWRYITVSLCRSRPILQLIKWHKHNFFLLLLFLNESFHTLLFFPPQFRVKVKSSKIMIITKYSWLFIVFTEYINLK